jgi:hypothetical protein
MYHRSHNMSTVEETVNEVPEYLNCRSCDTGDLLPLSDFGAHGAAVHYKAWVCSNPDCGFNLKIRNGDVFIGEPILDGQERGQREPGPPQEFRR